MSNAINIENSGAVLIVRFCRPEMRNPLSNSVLDEIDVVLDEIGPATETIMFIGTDNVFASGADLREIARIGPKSVHAFAERGQRLMDRIAGETRLTIAAVNGFCFGGALDLALACHRRIALPDATFCHPGAGLGIVTGWGGTQRLPRLIGEANALEMFFTAAPIDAERALSIGLVDEVVDSFDW